VSAADHPQLESSFEEFLVRIRPRLKSLFAHYRVPVQDTEDLLQQALLALVYQWKTVRDPDAWIIGTLRNKCLLYWRERCRRLVESVDTGVLEWVAQPERPRQENDDLRYDLDTMLARLPPRCRSVLTLRYRLGYEPQEVAERLGYRPSSISKVTNRCLAALTRQLVASGLKTKKTERP
jgi:RNA polymerase sigma factor (sigma-70 family)